MQLLNNPAINEVLDSLNKTMKEKRNQLMKMRDRRYEDIKDAINGASETVNEAAMRTNKTVRKNPWPYMGGVAATFLAAGYLLGFTRGKKRK